ncbi:hypothetical protein CYMTET_56262 [Cymbomonas tetramitiformis]|uniref:Ribonuclease n=2 Tax=Cymbomonas tetramitiformis TaxID=36881 RepID=A0AAE0BCQ7_9CHLO|nr:hypothetical protein CYMTET_56262 [Cymbomonas tetramitiformis]
MLGIDEAGRGPVLGDMVYGSAFCRVADKEYLAQQKYADSKTLTEDKRERLFELLKADDKMGWNVDVITPATLSAKMLRKTKESLNKNSHESAAGLVQTAIDAGVNICEIYVDTVGDPGRYQEILEKKFPGVRCTVAPKADSLYPIVSAASIAAKVTRDFNLKNWCFKESVKASKQFGSGYPGDPDTKSWLEDNFEPHFGYPNIVRFSWATTKKICDERGIDVEWEADVEDDLKGVATLNFGKKRSLPVAQTKSSGVNRHPYFKSRKLQRGVDF